MNVDSIHILELPVGNSIPSFLLKKILMSKSKDSDIISISINRNDSKSKGITRKQLLETKIESLDLDSSLVIYLDEWITGSNFNNILTILSKKKGLKILPGAFLTSESKNYNKYIQYRSKFDEIAKRLGWNSQQLLVELPTLNNTIVSQQKFIWTEFDRIAGYRKLEFLGSIISTFLAVGEALSDNSKLLDTTLKEAISEHTTLDPEVEIPQDFKVQILNSFQYFNSTFVSDLEDTISSVDIEINTNFDLEAETIKAISLFKSTKGYSNAQPAINIIGYYMKNKIISPASRYFYKGHVPVCIPLVGEEKNLSDLFIKEVENLVLWKPFA
ncbi:hypothetical protein GOQ04_25175 [Emticicia sp. ODNR4P]|nr:hypothetical protein [Emticicia sp. ODNR4P]